MKRKWCLALTGALLAMLMVTNADAGRFVRRLKHADRNKDGKVTPREWGKEKKWEHKKKSEVDTPREKKAELSNCGTSES